MKTRIAINKIHFPVTTLGFGRRIGVWTQGCSIRCPGCINRDTWHNDGSYYIDIASLCHAITQWLQQSDGVTISGGEPFDQPAALHELLKQLRARSDGDILVYSGYTHRKLLAEFQDIISSIDVLITEPFDANAPQTLNLRGSDNQRVFLLTELARRRYSPDLDRQPWPNERRMDVAIEGDAVFLAGIPSAGMTKRLREELAGRGFDCKTSEQKTIVRA